jgi:GntR family transcriptional regulator, transcriptional repressor for pyruvate dehydrogenase complex
MFTKIQARSVSDEIVDQIIAAIFSGRLVSGDRLPAERALSQAFGVGRQALREATQKLQGMGLLEVRKPQGTFVKPLTGEALQMPMARILKGDVGSFLQFLDIRKWMEAMTAAEAAAQATPEEVAAIEVTLPDLAAAAARQDGQALDKADVAFHMAIVSAAHNPLLVRLTDTFGSLMWSWHGLRLAVLRAQDLKAICAEHVAISAAIRTRSPERARDAMLHHIEMIRSRVEGMAREVADASGNGLRFAPFVPSPGRGEL